MWLDFCVPWGGWVVRCIRMSPEVFTQTNAVNIVSMADRVSCRRCRVTPTQNFVEIVSPLKTVDAPLLSFGFHMTWLQTHLATDLLER